MVADDSVVVTASEDTFVHAWRLSDLVSGPTEPVYSWSEHTLPITDVHITDGIQSTCLVATCSLDKTCRVGSP